MNAAFDVLLICNVNVYELSQRLLLRKNSLNVSCSFYFFPLISIINYLHMVVFFFFWLMNVGSCISF